MSRMPVSIPMGWRPQATSQATGRAWFDMSLVRWNGTVLQPIGGWAKLPNLQLNSAVRTMQSWRDNLAQRFVAAASLGQVMIWADLGWDITPADFTAGAPGDLVDGYGIGPFGVGTYGTPRTPDVAFTPRGAPGDTLQLDNWGENLVACGSADGRILWWVPTDDTTALLVPVPPADPTPEEAPGIVHVVPSARYAFVTDERFLVAIGASGDPRRVSWSDQERPGAWTEDVTNLCGSLQLNTTGIGRSARKIQGGTLIFCDDDVHLMTFLGPPFAYGILRVGTGCSAIGPQAIVASLARAAWMGQDCFWTWQGQPVPLECPVQGAVFGSINRNTQGRTVAAQNGIYPEFWWFYPDSSSVEPNRYVAWNYQQNIWIGGALLRTGLTEPAAYGLPLAGDIDGFVWAHENGWLADGADRGTSVFAQSGDLQLGEGDTGMVVRAIYPDLGGAGLAQFHIFGQWEAQDQMEDYGVYSPEERNDGVIDALFEARAIRIRIEGAGTTNPDSVQPWTLGRMRLDAVPGSGR
jgi:hypothetical protein